MSYVQFVGGSYRKFPEALERKKSATIIIKKKKSLHIFRILKMLPYHDTLHQIYCLDKHT